MSRAIFAENVFSHPDYTVGSGIPPSRSPDQPLLRVMDYTIGRDFHPATKTSIFYFQNAVIAVTSSADFYYIPICFSCKQQTFKNVSYFLNPGYNSWPNRKRLFHKL